MASSEPALCQLYRRTFVPYGVDSKRRVVFKDVADFLYDVNAGSD